MTDLLDSDEFRAWVANTVYGLSGIRVIDWRALERKCALTVAENGVNACQVGFEEYFSDRHSTFTPPNMVATTNKRVLH